jgi:hypothetical protein
VLYSTFSGGLVSHIRAALLLSIVIATAAAQNPPLTIVTTALPLAYTGGNYLQTLNATGGTPPYSWTLLGGTLPAGLTLSSTGLITGSPTGTGTSTLGVQVTDRDGSKATANLALTVIAPGTLARSGVLSHIAAGGSWVTSITLVTTYSAAVPVRVIFHNDDGSPLNLPVTVTQQGSAQSFTATTLDSVLGPNTTLIVETGAAPSAVVGWAEVLSGGPVSGYATFRFVPASGPSSEGAAPLQTQAPSIIVFPFDNTSGYVTGMAFANLSPTPVDVAVTVWDENGVQIGSQTFTVAAAGHTSFAVPAQIALTAGRRGIVRFQSSGSSGIAGLGLRFTPFGTFTSVPVL